MSTEADQVHLVERLAQARQLFGDVNPLSHFDGWRAPGELLPPEDRDEAVASESSGDGGDIP
jgi:hypothetical protein